MPLNHPYAYALGVVLCDGSLFVTQELRKSGERYARHCVALQCKDEAFMLRFTRALSEVVQKQVSYRPFSRRNFSTSTVSGLAEDYEFHGYVMRLTSRSLHERLHADRAALLEGACRWPQPESRSILAGIVDSDGYVRTDGGILIRTSKLAAVTSVCESAGIPGRPYDFVSQTSPEIHINPSSAIRIDTFKMPKVLAGTVS